MKSFTFIFIFVIKQFLQVKYAKPPQTIDNHVIIIFLSFKI